MDDPRANQKYIFNLAFDQWDTSPNVDLLSEPHINPVDIHRQRRIKSRDPSEAMVKLFTSCSFLIPSLLAAIVPAHYKRQTHADCGRVEVVEVQGGGSHD